MNYIDNFNEKIVGSDEVGVGDYFGPLVVAAVMIPEKNLDKILELGIKDSKLLTDSKINEIADKSKTLVLYSVKWLEPFSYNESFEKYKNFNILKTLLHNQSHAKLNNKNTIHIIDGFCSKENYSNYLKKIETNEPKIENVILKQKAESEYIQVALAAILARQEFLKWFKDQEKEFGTLPLGANQHVKDKVLQIKKAYGTEGLKKLTKMHFKI